MVGERITPVKGERPTSFAGHFSDTLTQISLSRISTAL